MFLHEAPQKKVYPEVETLTKNTRSFWQDADVAPLKPATIPAFPSLLISRAPAVNSLILIKI